MKVYLAAPFIDQEVTRQRRQELISIGIEVTSRWLDEDSSLPQEHGERFSSCAAIDLEDINAADYFVVSGENVSRTGGKHFETGFAFANGKNIILFESRENVFHSLPQIRFEKNWDAAKESLVRIMEAIEDVSRS